jgi:Signal transduction histidine kinase
LNKKAQNIAFFFEELKKTEKLKTKVLSIAAHDLRAPFASIQTLLQLEGLASMSSKELEMFFELLQVEVRKSSALLEEVLLWTESQLRNTMESRETFNVNDQIAHLLEHFKCDLIQKGMRICNNISGQLRISFSKDIFSFVVRNVLSNAVKFGHKKGVIVLNEIISEDRLCGLIVLNEGEQLPEDFIDELNHEDIWDHKKRISKNGAGLGISLCKDMIKRVGGNIFFENIKGIGVAVSIILPENQHSFSGQSRQEKCLDLM